MKNFVEQINQDGVAHVKQFAVNKDMKVMAEEEYEKLKRNFGPEKGCH